MNESLIDEAYVENAIYEERKQPESQRPVDLAQPESLYGMPNAGTTKYPAGREFDTLPWTEDDDHGSGADPEDHRVRRKYRPNQSVTDLVASGHGFGIQRFSNPERSEHCKYCGGRLIPPALEWPCECPNGNPNTAPWFDPVTDCRCNGCQIREMGVRKRGGQPIQCGAPACKSQYTKERSQKQRDRKAKQQRQAAIPLIKRKPYRPDASIAEELGIPRKRVKEAREFSMQ